jgi:hypothetical protein
VSVNGGPAHTVHVSGLPDLYTLVAAPTLESGRLNLTFSPGVQVYDFTFG